MIYFTEEKFDLYYNCTALTNEEWELERNPNLIIGLLYMLIGITFLILYIPAVFILLDRELLTFCCFKILLFLSIIDIFILILSCLVCGYLSIVGQIFCSARIPNYIIGMIAMGLWTLSSATCVLLSINRLLDVHWPEVALFFFEGYKTLGLLTLPIMYSLFFALCVSPAPYSSKSHGFFFDVYHKTSVDEFMNERFTYTSILHSLNNYTFIIMTICVYGVLFSMLIYKYKKNDKNFKLTNFKKKALIQCVFVCSLSLISGSIYIYMQYFPTSTFIVIIGQMAWQFNSGISSVIFIFLNDTTRRVIAQSFLPTWFKQLIGVTGQSNTIDIVQNHSIKSTVAT
uniref:Serpentine Receptor, class T n=1 Tax=Rhabditophanes sp. KR3021 TaxID=114890 RepID=A0AC35TFV6_9BILA